MVASAPPASSEVKRSPLKTTSPDNDHKIRKRLAIPDPDNSPGSPDDYYKNGKRNAKRAED